MVSETLVTKILILYSFNNKKSNVVFFTIIFLICVVLNRLLLNSRVALFEAC